jgi:hypothetical protein
VINAKTSLNRAALKASAATLVLALLASPVAGLAQTATAAADAAAEDDGTIVVTGSLIKNPNLISAAPINVTTADTIQLRGSNVAEEVLREIPGIVPNIGSAVNNGNGGASFVDLRGIGANRNIVLLDGNRIAPSGLAGQVDLNNIPLALIERVDALTGAAARRLAGMKQGLESGDAHPVLLVVVARVLLPMSVVVGAFIFLRGHNLPGGGFIAGLVVAMALIILQMPNRYLPVYAGKGPGG